MGASMASGLRGCSGFRVASLLLLLGDPCVCSASSNFGQPTIPSLSATCAAVDFPYYGSGAPEEVYLFAKRPEDPHFIQWGGPMRPRKVRSAGLLSAATYRVLMRELPPGQRFQVRMSHDPSSDFDDKGPPSEMTQTLQTAARPAPPSALQIHRTDPRLNKVKRDGSVCVDLHWSHPHPQLRQQPDDVYFRITFNGMHEPPEQFCTDEVGHVSRECGGPLASVGSALPSSYATLCGLRPARELRFSVEAFNCDLQRVTQHLQAFTPPSAPSVVMTKVTHPPPQESVAGFRPLVVLEWMPQADDLIEGHAVYLGLADVSAIKLLCWVPKGQPAHLDLPIVQRNYTHSEDSELLRDYWDMHPVHQEQELTVAVRTAVLRDGVIVSHLESPATAHRLGGWLVMDDAVKCLTSFDAQAPGYVSRPVVLSWTQEQALSLYD